MKKFLIGAALAFSSATGANAATLVIDLEDVFSYTSEGSAANVLWSFDIGANALVTGIAYDVTLEAFSPSWLSEMVVSFLSSSFSGVYLTPGFSDSFSGTASYADSAYLPDYGLDFAVDGDGLLWLEFFEDFDDSSISPDGVWNGTLTITYEPTATPGIPEPATWGMMIAGFGLVGFAARRRTTITSA